MTQDVLRSFFLWCTIINLVIYLIWVGAVICAPDFIYQVQNRFFPFERAKYNVTIYKFIGGYKLLILFFNVVPLLALAIVH